MSAQRLALQTLKSIEATAKTRSAFKFSRVSNLARLVRVLGYGFLLFDLSPMAAQTLAYVDKGYTPPQPQPTAQPSAQPAQPVRSLYYRTGETYTLRSGEVRDVLVGAGGRKYILRPSGRKYYPKSLNH